MIEQKVLNLRDDEYYNFFFTAGYFQGPLVLAEDGWTLKFIKDDPNRKMAMAVFEREQQCQDDKPHNKTEWSDWDGIGDD